MSCHQVPSPISSPSSSFRHCYLLSVIVIFFPSLSSSCHCYCHLLSAVVGVFFFPSSSLSFPSRRVFVIFLSSLSSFCCRNCHLLMIDVLFFPQLIFFTVNAVVVFFLTSLSHFLTLVESLSPVEKKKEFDELVENSCKIEKIDKLLM